MRGGGQCELSGACAGDGVRDWDRERRPIPIAAVLLLPSKPAPPLLPLLTAAMAAIAARTRSAAVCAIG